MRGLVIPLVSNVYHFNFLYLRSSFMTPLCYDNISVESKTYLTKTIGQLRERERNNFTGIEAASFGMVRKHDGSEKNCDHWLAISASKFFWDQM